MSSLSAAQAPSNRRILLTAAQMFDPLRLGPATGRPADDARLAPVSKREVERMIIERVYKEPNVRERLLQAPRRALDEDLGVIVPQSVALQIVEDTDIVVHIVLPANPYEDIAEDELRAHIGCGYDDVVREVLDLERGSARDDAVGPSLIARAWRDRGFKRSLLLDPKRIIEQAMGAVVPISFIAIEETIHQICIVLPKRTADSYHGIANALLRRAANWTHLPSPEPEPDPSRSMFLVTLHWSPGTRPSGGTLGFCCKW